MHTDTHRNSWRSRTPLGLFLSVALLLAVTLLLSVLEPAGTSPLSALLALALSIQLIAILIITRSTTAQSPSNRLAETREILLPDDAERRRADQALQERLAFERLITQISTEFINLATDQIDSGILRALQFIGEFTASDRSYVFVFSEDGTRIDNPYEWCRPGILSLQPLYRDQPASIMPWTTDQIKRGQVLHVPVFADLPPQAHADQSQMQSHVDPPLSFINVPMVSHGQVVGLLGFDAVRAEQTWSEDSIDLLRIVGEIFVNAFDRKRAEQALAERRAFERLITNISTEFINVDSEQMDAAIQRALGAIGQFAASDRSYVILFSPDGKLMTNTHEWCREGVESHQARHRDQPVEDYPSVIPQIKQGQAVVIPSYDNFPEGQAERECGPACTTLTQSIVVVPLVYRGQVVGQLGLDAVRAKTAWSEDSLALLRIVGEILMNALEHKRAAEALRRSELRFRTMFENAGIGIAILDEADRTIQTNPAITQFLGYTQEEFNHIDQPDYTYPEDYSAQKILEDQLAAGQRDRYDIEKRYVRKDGRVVWGRLVESIARDATGQVLYRLGMVEDINEQKLAEQKLAEANQTLELRVAERTLELAMVNAISSTVSRSLDLKEVMSDALDQLMDLMRMDYGVAYRVEGGTGDAADQAHLKILAHRRFSAEFVRYADGLPVRETAAGYAGAQGQPMAWQVADLPIDDDKKRQLEKERVAQVISIPLLAKGRYLGTLNIGSSTVQVITPEQLVLLRTIGQQVGVAVENARLYEQAEQSAQAAERSRLARELHDSITQSLYSMTLYAEATARLLTRGRQAEAVTRLRDLRDTAQEALRAMRLLIFELRPPALEKGLAAALQSRLDSVESRCGVDARLQVNGKETLPFPLQAELYHIALEALNNALKHARAQTVHVQLEFEPARVHLQIRDDGTGFEMATMSEHGGFGISGMRERARRVGGTLDITSAPGAGTCVEVLVPINPEQPEERAP